MKINWQGRQKAYEAVLSRELRRTFLLILGLTIYAALYLAFSVAHNPSRASREVQPFPRKVWQSWKVDPTSFEDRDSERARTWITKNPTIRYEVLTDGNGLAYVEHVFRPSGYNRPDIISTYKSLSDKIIQADLLRYIIMYAEGGIWADIDVEAIRPFKHFVPKRYDEFDLDMIIGIETDEPDFKDHPVLGSKAQSFCQWTFVCKPELPVMMRLIEHIIIWLDKLSKEQGKSISQIELDFDEVLSGTGPSAFTDAILTEMTTTHGHPVTWADFHNLEESTVVGRVLVLPSEAFAAGTGHSSSGNHAGKGALVKHHFHASSWTKSHPRFKHPIYGEVEKCNWEEECIRLWDVNTAFFNSLSPQEQGRMIAIKELDSDQMLKTHSDSETQIIVNIPQDAPIEYVEEHTDGSQGQHEQTALVEPPITAEVDETGGSQEDQDPVTWFGWPAETSDLEPPKEKHHEATAVDSHDGERSTPESDKVEESHNEPEMEENVDPFRDIDTQAS